MYKTIITKIVAFCSIETFIFTVFMKILFVKISVNIPFFPHGTIKLLFSTTVFIKSYIHRTHKTTHTDTHTQTHTDTHLDLPRYRHTHTNTHSHTHRANTHATWLNFHKYSVIMASSEFDVIILGNKAVIFQR